MLLDVSDCDAGGWVFDKDVIKKVYEIRVRKHRVVRLFIQQCCDMNIHVLVIEGIFL